MEISEISEKVVEITAIGTAIVILCEAGFEYIDKDSVIEVIEQLDALAEPLRVQIGDLVHAESLEKENS